MSAATSTTNPNPHIPSSSGALGTPRTPGSLDRSLARTFRLGLERARYEIAAYFRRRDALVFTFLFPIVMMSIFSAAFANLSFGPAGSEMNVARYYLPAMLAAGILLSGVQNLGVDIAGERGDGTLKRLAGTPLPVASYFIGKLGQALVTATAQAALLILVARVLFGVALPTEPQRWLTFAWVFLLGVLTSAVLGIAISRLPRSGRSATAVIVPVTIVLQFISGVYLQFSQLPEWLQNTASVFPLKWLAQGMRSVFLPDDFVTLEQGGSWQLPEVAIVCGVWLVAGLVLCRLTFRWIREDG